MKILQTLQLLNSAHNYSLCTKRVGTKTCFQKKICEKVVFQNLCLSKKKCCEKQPLKWRKQHSRTFWEKFSIKTSFETQVLMHNSFLRATQLFFGPTRLAQTVTCFFSICEALAISDLFQVEKTNIEGECEFLFVPYSVFTVLKVDWKSPATWTNPHIIELEAAIDNQLEPDDLPLINWH